ncbi:hypothetical protein LAZ67_X000661 [Cordylochernes scorpioides]|uniref:Apple domain-containing protein n=1 Tax=Cordylochernes scorpioides TaxID=51811 RepID=A0ABY6LUE8_9ARAC|nr:hypothetical protein LAZ67_X000661 [Cordylochernes scorpioides]
MRSAGTVMVPLVSFLAALRLLTQVLYEETSAERYVVCPAQTCNNGQGRVVYEKVDNNKLAISVNFGVQTQVTEALTRSEFPLSVLRECARRCLEDRTTTIPHCLTFDFLPGLGGNNSDYGESTCLLHFEESGPEGAGHLVPEDSAAHFHKVCLDSSGEILVTIFNIESEVNVVTQLPVQADNSTLSRRGGEGAWKG